MDRMVVHSTVGSDGTLYLALPLVMAFPMLRV